MQCKMKKKDGTPCTNKSKQHQLCGVHYRVVMRWLEKHGKNDLKLAAEKLGVPVEVLEELTGKTSKPVELPVTKTIDGPKVEVPKAYTTTISLKERFIRKIRKWLKR